MVINKKNLTRTTRRALWNKYTWWVEKSNSCVRDSAILDCQHLRKKWVRSSRSESELLNYSKSWGTELEANGVKEFAKRNRRGENGCHTAGAIHSWERFDRWGEWDTFYRPRLIHFMREHHLTDLNLRLLTQNLAWLVFCVTPLNLTRL